MDLSLLNTVDERKCGFEGCDTCPYQVRDFKSHACIAINYVTGLYDLQYLETLLEVEKSNLADIINEDSEDYTIDTEDECVDFDVIHQPQIDQLIAIAKPLVDRIPELLIPGSIKIVRSEYKAWVKEHLILDHNYSIDNEQDDYNIFLFLDSIKEAYQFLLHAKKLNKSIEIGRYDFRKQEAKIRNW